jgi:CobQ-like glutamine amidotransferase family enzyme
MTAFDATALTIVHLYPRELGINGDVGNVTALATRARWRGIQTTIHDHNQGDDLPENFDLVHIGSGPLSSQRAVHADLMRIAPALKSAAEDGVPFLAIAGGWQLLSRGFRTPAGEDIEGAGVFPSSTVIEGERAVGEIVVKAGNVTLAGFENHSGVTTLEPDAAPLGTVISGLGNTPGADRQRRAEGIRIGASIGTHLHGPFLPMNPAIADELLRAALHFTGDWPDSTAIQAVDASAAKARDAIAARLGVRL